MSTCLVIIDVQRGFVSERTKDVPERIKQLAKLRPFDHIVATRFMNREGSPYQKFMGWRGLMDDNSQEIYPVVAGLPEQVFPKFIYSCFTDEFVSFMHQQHIDKLFFVGIDTDCCVLKSASDCFEKNIDFEVITDCCGSNGGFDSHQAALTVMRRMVGKKVLVESGVVVNE